MKKKIDRTMVLSTLVCLLPALLALALYSRLPEQIPTHWNFAGEIDGYSGKAVAAFGLPGMMALGNVVLHFVMNNDPKQGNAARTLIAISKWLLPVMSVIVVPMCLLAGLGWDIPTGSIVPALVGILFIAIGNYLPKCKQNYTIGIKLPWTLNSEENWNKTHRLAGYVWMIGGILVAVLSVLDLSGISILLIPLIVMVLIPTVYSYRLYKKGI